MQNDNAFTRFQNLGYFAGLDGIRCLAIIAVIWHHTVQTGFLPMFDRGYLGVDLFFVLSGFLITTLLLREKSKTGKISLGNFWIRRFLRLMPAYYGLLVALLLAYGIFKPEDPNTARLFSGFPVYALYLSNWFNPGANNLDPLWSLATEEQFYLVWPVIEAFFAPVIMLITFTAFLIINQLVNFGVLDGAILSVFGVAPDAHPEILQSTFTPILLGVALAHGLTHKAIFTALSPFITGKARTLGLGVVLLILLNVPAGDISGLLRALIHMTMALFIGSIVLSPDSRLTQAFEVNIFKYVGTISYGMYLFHMWVVFAASVILTKIGLSSGIILFVLVLFGTIAISAVSFTVYEKPFLNLRHRFRA